MVLPSIYAKYLEHVSTGLQPLLAAVAALTDAIEFHSVTTVTETLSLLSSSSEQLQAKSGLVHLIRPGIAAFRRWLVLLLERPSAGGVLNPPFKVQLPPDDFDARKAWIVEACREYVKQGRNAKEGIAKNSQSLLLGQRDLKILVHVCDEVVSSILVELAKSGRYFEVALVQPLYLGCDSDAPDHELLKKTHNDLPKQLQEFDIPVFEIAPQTVAILLQSGPRVVLTASLLVNADASVFAPVGTYQTSILANAASCPFYVAAEAYKLSSELPTVKDIAMATSKLVSAGKGVPMDVAVSTQCPGIRARFTNGIAAFESHHRILD